MIIEGKEYKVRMNGCVHHCALDVTMSYIGGNWKAVYGICARGSSVSVP